MLTDDTLREWRRLADEWKTYRRQRPGEHVIRCQDRIDEDHRRISKATVVAFPALCDEVERLRNVSGHGDPLAECRGAACKTACSLRQLLREVMAEKMQDGFQYVANGIEQDLRWRIEAALKGEG